METKYLKKYAPEARREFIEAVTNKAAVYGLLPDEIIPMQEEGDVVIIGDRPFPRSVAKQRKELEDRIRKEGFQQFIEAIAYTWFNRFVAIRYMELQGYLDHGYRVLSHPEEKTTPEILENAERIELPGLNQDEVVDLKLDGGKDEQLYQMLLLAQCNALHKAMPFLFESIRDGTELLLPDNLLHTDSLVRTLVNDIPEEQWEDVEIIGWLYQFYISEKKDEVIGKVVKSEDIPAATQLFTPNWIVKYLVQNSLGRQWMATYPDSPLREQMEFYIEPAEQTAEVQQQLVEITPESLNPEELTLLDPACGSGHILVESYDLFKAIYTERGYRARDIPKLILEKNLFGLEIDDRAAQLAAFALMMKARADERGIFDRGVQLNVLSIQESKGLDAQEITESLNAPLPDGATGEISHTDVANLIELFSEGKTFGSLIRVPETLVAKLRPLASRVAEVANKGGMFERASAALLRSLLSQSHVLSCKFSAVVMNPPYMGTRNGMNLALKTFAKRSYPSSKNDLFAIFIERASELTHERGTFALITMHSWMFLSSFEDLRKSLLNSSTLLTLAHLGARAFDTISGEVVTVTAFSALKHRQSSYAGKYFRLTDGNAIEKRRLLAAQQQCFKPTQDTFSSIPGSPVAYWISSNTAACFSEHQSFGEVADTAVGLFTCDNDRFLRCWWEVDVARIGFGIESRDAAARSENRFFPYNKGGGYRPWYGLNWLVVQFNDDGRDIRVHRENSGQSYSLPGEQYYFRPGITWSGLTTDINSFRMSEPGFLFESNKGQMAFTNDDELMLGFLNSKCCQCFVSIMNPTLSLQSSEIKKLPVAVPHNAGRVREAVRTLVQIHKDDWDAFETSWDFAKLPLIRGTSDSVEGSYQAFQSRLLKMRTQTSDLSEIINEAFIEAFDLKGQLDATVSAEEITLHLPEREGDVQHLLSYSVGCMMGRYSLDEPGLIYAQTRNEGFDSHRYSSFPADDDGIVPITDVAWFPDDAANRFEEFVKSAWTHEHLEENLAFVAESLGKKKSETSRERVRRYFATGFYKHHMSMYKKRPIYWLFSSGKQRAFQCLVYLHRYNAGTLSRMRTEYVVPLQGKMNTRIEQLESDIPAASSTSHRKKLEKERDTLVKQREELQEFDEKLRHFADQRIELDLDDGVKLNYGKFGDLLAEVKAITGKKPKVEVTT